MVIGTHTPDNLFGAARTPHGIAGTLADTFDLARGVALGRILLDAGDPVPDGGNDGDGVLQLALGPQARVASYRFECIAPANGDPAVFNAYRDGQFLGSLNAGEEWVHEDATVTITIGAAPWAAGDGISLAVGSGSMQFRPVDSENRDGSQYLAGILAAACDASGGAAPCAVYVTGIFSTRAVVFVNGDDSYEDFEELARKRGIYFRATVAA